jgi:RimJ/RimL family protein N-acetyltransferase
MNLRHIETGDWAELRRMLERMAEETPPVALELEPLLFKTEQWIRSFPMEEQGIFIVCEENDEIIGFCYLVVPKFYRPVAYIGIAVDKEHRKMDIGTQMFYHVLEWAASQHLSFIISDVWSWNKASILYFTRLGFEETTRFEDKFKGKQKEKIRLVKKV